MKKTCLLSLALAIAVSCSKSEPDTTIQQPPSTNEEVDHSIVQGEAIVKFDDEMIELIESDLNQGKLVTRSIGLNQALDEIGISSFRRLFPDASEYEPRTRREGLHKWYVVNYETSVAQTRATAELESITGVEYVESHRVAVTNGFNDPGYPNQWGYVNPDGNGYDINVLPVWSGYTTGNPKVIVAVVDEGVDVSHEDLASNCSHLNYSAISYNNTVVPGSHGTHVAGTIAAVNNNGIGVCGVAGGDAAKGKRGVSIMSCEILREVTKNGKKEVLNGSSAAAIKWAADHGAVICQNSWGYSYDRDGDGKLNAREMAEALAGKISASDKEAIDYFIKYAGCDNDGNQLADSPMKGGLVVFAAGNDGIRNGVPANYEAVIAVASIGNDGRKASYSNYGDFVDIAAPGSSIYSTLPNGKYGYLSGTSMACPHVSGVAALAVSYYGGVGFTCDELKERILATKKTKNIADNIGGLVDAMGALTYGGDFIPGKVKGLSGSVNSNELKLSWPVSGDDAGHPAYGYSVMLGKDRAAVEAAVPTSGNIPDVMQKVVFCNAGIGETISVDVDGLDFECDYYAKVTGFSYSRTYGDASDVVRITTGANNPPVIELDAGDHLILKSHESKVIRISMYDPDGHLFSYDYKAGSVADSFMETPGGFWQMSINANMADAGEYMAEITATDSYGAATTKRISYVVLENTPPNKIKDIEDIFTTAIGSEFTMNMTDYFIDPDGENLSFEITSSNPSVAYFAQNEDRIIGTVLKYGATVVTVTAVDAKKAKAQAEFRLLAREASVKYAAYPNPVKDVLKVATGKDLEEIAVRIVSQTGAIVYDGSLKASAFEPAEIDMSRCAPGKYMATLRIGSKEYNETIIKN